MPAQNGRAPIGTRSVLNQLETSLGWVTLGARPLPRPRFGLYSSTVFCHDAISSRNQTFLFAEIKVGFGNRPVLAILKSVARETGTISKTCASFSMRRAPTLLVFSTITVSKIRNPFSGSPAAAPRPGTSGQPRRSNAPRPAWSRRRVRYRSAPGVGNHACQWTQDQMRLDQTVPAVSAWSSGDHHRARRFCVWRVVSRNRRTAR